MENVQNVVHVCEHKFKVASFTGQ